MLNSTITKGPVRFPFLPGITPAVKQTIKVTLFCLFLFITKSLRVGAQTDTWVQKSDFGYNAVNVTELIPRTSAICFSIGTKGYIGTGYSYDGTDHYYKDFWEYDPVVNTWTQKADFGGTARAYAVGFNIGDKGYLGTGTDINGYSKDFWEYNPDANTWVRKADFGGTARWSAIGFSIGNKGYLGTGSSLVGVTFNIYKDFWEYDPSANIWIEKADFGGTARHHAVGFSIGTKGFLGTGQDISNNYKKDFWEYNPDANTWVRKADFGGTARQNAVGFSITSKGYIGTGYGDIGTGYSNMKDYWEYDPTANTWSEKADFGGIGRSNAIGFSIGSKGYLGTGYDYVVGYTKDFWEYDPTANVWTRQADFGVISTARADAVGFSIGTKGYLGTGYSYDGTDHYYKDFWEFDPATNTWTQKADFAGTARAYAVGFSIDSKGYVGTGQNGLFPNYSFYSDFWEYDPDANTWTQKADFGGTARSSAVGFSISKKGYLGTGNSVFPIYYKDFWEYDPSVNTWSQKADFGGTTRSEAVGFNIGNKGYLGTGEYYDMYGLHYYKDFWEYDPVENDWTRKANIGGLGRSKGTGFSIGNRGYLGTGSRMQDFWEYDPVTNIWSQKADFGGANRSNAVGFSIGSKGYIGTGEGDSYFPNITAQKDFWEFISGGCPVPVNLRVPKFSDTCARLNWDLTNSSVEHIKISYRPIGNAEWKEERKKAGENSIIICGLKPNTTYEWKVRNICTDDKTDWVKGPNFSTKSSPSFSSNAESIITSKVQGNVSVQIIPNPNRGNFSLQMQLADKAASTTLSLYNNLGARVWQQDAGRLSGSVNMNIVLESKLSAGLYVLQVQHGDTRLMQKVVVIK